MADADAILDLEVTAVAAGGDGLARADDGRVVFVEGALPGERVRAATTEEKRDFLRASIVEVVDPSPDRVEPPCAAVAAGCGGCQWQHVAPDAQRRLKRDIVVDALRRLGHLTEPPVAPEVAGVPAAAYRTTLRAAVGRDGRPLLHRRHSRELVAVDGCLVAHPALAELLTVARFPGAAEATLRVSAATGERVVTMHGSRHRDQGGRGGRGGRGGKGGPRALVPQGVQVGGHITEEVAGRPWRVSVGSFFQSGPAAAGVLVDEVCAAAEGAVGPGGSVVDAYAGMGLLGGALAESLPAGAVLTAIESNPPAARDARVNLRELDAKVLQIEVADWQAPGRPTDLVVADPARPGLGRPGVDALAAAGAPVFVLVSCDPASLARDTTLLAGAGYRLVRTKVLDLFPHTVHVETVSRYELSRSS